MNTNINITIGTGCQNSNPLEEARQQIERATYYLDSIFKLTLLAKENSFANSDALESIALMSEIGQGINESIRQSVRVLSTFKRETNYEKFEVVG